MSRRLVSRARITRERIYLFGPPLLLALIGFLVALYFVQPAPPRRIVMATGATDGAYHQFGLRYQRLLARDGVELEIRSTAGAVENVRLLKDSASGVDVAFVQGGVLAAEDGDQLLALGTLYLEPIWIFSRTELTGLDISGLAGKRIAVGPDGSGTRVVAEMLLDANGVSQASSPRIPVTGQAAKEALDQGRADAAFYVTSIQSPVLREIASRTSLRLMSIDRAEAYTRRFPFLARVVLPRGGLSLASDVPSRDVVLLAAPVNLISRTDFHPALAGLLLMTASRIHGGPGLFEKARQFPSADHVDVPLSPEASRYYQSGPPFLNRYLPFWVATLVDRLKVMLVPLIALLFPLFKVVPPLYRWRVRSKIYRWYRDLDLIDQALARRDPPGDPEALLDDLDRVEDEVRQVAVPPSYRDDLYHLRVHIDLLRTKVGALKGRVRV